MAAANTDKFKKVARKWVGQIGSGGVADETTTTIPLSSATNLPTDTAVEVVIDRVDANGTKTPSTEETVTGVVSGSNLINCVRGVEGTAQAHDAGAVVEILITASLWEDLIDGILVEHGQDGTHTAASTSAAGKVELATIAETDTGTDATRAVTPDGLQGSKINIRYLQFRLIASDTDVATDTDVGGDFICPFDGTILQDDTLHDQLFAWTDTAGTTGTMVVDIHLNGTTIMTTNKLDIETGEQGTQTATTQPDLTTTDISAGDVITFDIDAVHTTAAKGLVIGMAIRED